MCSIDFTARCMKQTRTLLIAIAILTTAVSSLHAQQETEALEGSYPLNDRFQLLKSKSQNYREYKVIRENVLDSFWKIVRDSVASKEAALASKDQNILSLKKTLAETQTALKEKEASMEEIVHDSTHITVLGISFSKGAFITIVAVLVGVLVLLLALVTGRLKMVNNGMRERADAFTSLSAEFEEYKRKAMEKQTKLSRELQNERNRLSESRGI